MAKKSLCLLLPLILCSQVLLSQTEKTPYTGPSAATEEKPVVFRDRLILDIYHSFWMGMPAEVNFKKFDPGFNVSAIWDFKLKKKPLAFGLGLGVSYFTQYSNALLRHDVRNDIMCYYVLPQTVEYKLLKMNYLNVNIPLEFRYRHPNGFKFSLGLRVGLIAEISQKYKGPDPSEPSETLKMKNLDIRDKLKYNTEVYTRIGWKFINVYYGFQFTPLFVKDKGPKIYPMSMGISLSIF